MENEIKFSYLGKNLKHSNNLYVLNPENIGIGNNVSIANNVYLYCHPQGNKNENLKIVLKDRAFMGVNSMVEAFNKVIIEEDVMISPFAYISDSQHKYSDINTTPNYQGYKNLTNTLTLRRGCWIGHSATIIGNINIGYGSVIGANSMVNFDVPSHCVIIGNPGRILKIYHYKTNEWIYPKTENELMTILDDRGKFKGYDDREILKKINIGIDKLKNNK